MSILSESRPSDSPFIDRVTRGYTLSDGSSTRPAECHWHMVVRHFRSSADLLVVGPLTGAGVAAWGEGADLLWLRFSLGVFMPGLPVATFLDTETPLPAAGSRSFWLDGSTWPLPTYENIETFVARLARRGLLLRDPAVDAALRGEPAGIPDRTLRHRFQRATGLTRGQVEQIQRAQRAAALLARGVPILDTVEEAGYFDQPHLTRALRRWVGHTPARLLAQKSTA